MAGLNDAETSSHPARTRAQDFHALANASVESRGGRIEDETEGSPFEGEAVGAGGRGRGVTFLTRRGHSAIRRSVDLVDRFNRANQSRRGEGREGGSLRPREDEKACFRGVSRPRELSPKRSFRPSRISLPSRIAGRRGGFPPSPRDGNSYFPSSNNCTCERRARSIATTGRKTPVNNK